MKRKKRLKKEKCKKEKIGNVEKKDKSKEIMEKGK